MDAFLGWELLESVEVPAIRGCSGPARAIGITITESGDPVGGR